MRTYNLQRLFHAPAAWSPDDAPAVAPAAIDSPLGGQASTPAPAGEASVAGTAGADSVPSGADALYGSDTQSGTDTTSGTDTSSGTDTASGTDSESGADSLTAASYDTLTLPDTITVNDEVLGQFKEFAATNGLSKEAAQTAIDMFAGQLTAQGETFALAQKAAWDTTITAWKTELAKVPEFAGERAAVAQATIGRALDIFGDQATRDAFDLTGAGHHPAVIKFIHKMASALNEGNLIPGGNPSPKGPMTPGQALYGNEGT